MKMSNSTAQFLILFLPLVLGTILFFTVVKNSVLLTLVINFIGACYIAKAWSNFHKAKNVNQPI